MMKLSQLVSFLAVVEHKSIRAAARALGVTQPGISKTMHDLESDLQVPLLKRLSGGIELTEFGHLLQVRASLLLQEVHRIKASLHYLRDFNTGHVTLGASASAAHTLLPLALEHFMAESPAIEITIKEGSLSLFRTGLRDGTLDFVIANLPVGMTDDEFEVSPLFTFKNVIGVRDSFAGPAPTHLKHLRDFPWIVPGPGGSTGGNELITSLFAAHKVELPKRIIRCESLATGLGMMANADLIGLFTKPLADLEFQRMGLKTLEVAERIPAGQIALVFNQNTQQSLAAERLVALLRLNAANFKNSESVLRQKSPQTRLTKVAASSASTRRSQAVSPKLKQKPASKR